METKKFDALTRSYAVAPSRRQFVRAGVGALASSALAAVGLTGVHQDADARKRCRSVGLKQVCSSNKQCCPSKTGTICSWNYCRSDDLAVCCKPAGGSCLFDCDCCGQNSFCSGAGVCQ